MSESVVTSHADEFTANFEAAIADAEAAEAAASDDGDGGEPVESAESADESTETEDEAKTPAPSQWVALRKKQQKIAQREAESVARVEQLAAQAAERLQPYHAAAEALKAGDWDSLAREIGKAAGEEIEDWAGLNKTVIRRFASPEYQKVQQLDRKLRETERQQREAEEARQAQAAQAQRVQAQQQYIAELDSELKSSEDELVAAAAQDSAFAAAVFQEQANAWDNASGVTIDTAEATQRVLKRIRKAYDGWHKIFGDRAPTPETRPATRRQSNPTKTVSPRKAVQASPSGALSDEENFQLTVRELAEAMRGEAGE